MIIVNVNRNGLIKQSELSEDSKKFINECLCFNEFFTLSEADQYSGIRELLEHLLIIDPARRWDANTALRESSFLQDTASAQTTSTSSN